MNDRLEDLMKVFHYLIYSVLKGIWKSNKSKRIHNAKLTQI